MANATIGEAVPLEEEAGTARGKREAEEDAGDGGDISLCFLLLPRGLNNFNPGMKL